MKGDHKDRPYKQMRAFSLLFSFLILCGNLNASEKGFIQGQVNFVGTPPPPQTINKRSDSVCSKTHPEQDGRVLVNANGTLKNVIIRVIAGVPKSKTSKNLVRLTQVNCSFTPRVIAALVGQKIEINNSDPIVHNVHARFEGKSLFSRAAMPKAKGHPKNELPLGKTEVGCDVHPWEKSYIITSENEFFQVTGEDGKFKLGLLPDGAYTLEAWHEVYGVQIQDATLVHGVSPEINFTFQP